MSKGLFDLSGKTALITGGSRGIGLGIAKGFATAGAEVSILARDKDQLQKALNAISEETGKAAKAFVFDLEKKEGLPEVFGDVVRQMGGVDILVNCAGMTIREAAEDVKLENFEKVMGVNLTAVFLMSQAFCRHRKESKKGGRIINIGSLMCRGARATTTAYAASKGGLLMLTKSLAVEWAKYNINVNAIGPGYIATELAEKLRSDEQFNKWVLSRTPLGRWGQPKDIAGTAVFLASKASDFVTGQIIYVDGGWLAGL